MEIKKTDFIDIYIVIVKIATIVVRRQNNEKE